MIKALLPSAFEVEPLVVAELGRVRRVGPVRAVGAVASDADVARRAVVVHCADDGRVRLRVGAAAAAELAREITDTRARRSFFQKG